MDTKRRVKDAVKGRKGHRKRKVMDTLERDSKRQGKDNNEHK